MPWVARMLATAGLWGILAAPASAEPRVAFTRDLGGPVALPEACPNQDSDAWPVLAANPRRPGHLRGVVQRGGVEAAASIHSSDGGRSWQTEALRDATRCAGGPQERQLSVNPLMAVGARGHGYHGQSWASFDGDGGISYGIAVHALGSGRPGASPDGDTSSQNAAVAAGFRRAGRVGALWTDLDQVPNPFTYAPTGSRVRFARSDDGGVTWPVSTVVWEPGPDLSVINARMVRTGDRGLLALWDVAETADVPAGVLGLASDAGLRIYTSRSDDWGESWSDPVEVGTHQFLVVDDPDHDGSDSPETYAVSAKPSLAAGPAGRLAVTAAAPAGEDGRSAVRLATSDDGGRSWTPQTDAFTVEGQLIQPEVAFDRRGRLGVAFYDFSADEPGDEAGWEITPRAAVLGRGGWETVVLSKPFDLHATNECTNPSGLPFGTSCELVVDAMAIGVYPSIVGLRSGFGAGYTVGPPLARDGFTDARFARIRP